ncbi:hypothetical protein [Arthrobacter antibioticus]|uniref:hypothetical protein n=1 Tax=Arthrobacter sp. H35-MC1 TaxID=3046203 RepID=UPI0024B89AAE|nr:hypothetical protein [Arthrobacter sp. H35-MC1]MDJ0318357.1 hypothetical protein [Arthrobacter sp. H35-MC1]
MQQNKSDDIWDRMFEDLSNFARELPSPPRRCVADADRTQSNIVETVAVAWGWMQRVVRTSEAVHILGRSGYTHEAAPLRRSIMEHATRLNWAVGIGGDRLMELLLKVRAASDARYQIAAKDGFSLDDDQLAWLSFREQEQSDRYAEDSQLAHIGHVFNSDPSLYGATRQGWLWETARSHPTLDTAEIYYSISDAGKVVLRDSPKNVNAVRDIKQICAYLLIAIEAYVELVGLGETHAERVQDLGIRLKETAAK